MNPADVAQTALPTFSQSLSIWTLFWQAHIVVKLVLIGLIFASVWCWAIILNKTLLYRRLAKAMDQFEEVFWSGQSLDELYRNLSQTQPTGMGAVFLAAMTEWKRSIEGGSGRAFGSLAGRVEKVMDVAIQRETERLNSGLMVLSNIASAAPFIGLFGTVWGIMNSFMAIAAAKNTSLAVVAPGISESLFATAIGLVAAIPAVIAYNSFAARVANLQTRLEGFADEFSAILSRQVDQRLAA
jgi:biopolymer transport protein TolQ